MKNIIAGLAFLLPLLTLGQSTAKDFIQQGVALHDNGKFREAIEAYEKALTVEKDNQDAYYEIALSYTSLKEHEKAIEFAEKLIKSKKDFVAKGYHLKGMNLDYMGKQKEAVDAFKKGSKANPKYTTLYYSTAITSYALKDTDTAIKALEDGLSYNRYHIKSHYMLGVLMMDKDRPKSLLALYHYLLLNPTGTGANNAYNLILSQQKIGVEVKDDKNITINVKPIDDKDNFAPAELMLSMLEAAKNIDENKNKTDFEMFSENTKSFFQVLKELKQSGKHKGFWWDFYVGFFSDLIADPEMYETFTYYVSQDVKSTEIETWLRKNSVKVTKLEYWVANYKK